VPRLSCTYTDFIAIIESHGFVLVRHDGTSHRMFRGVVGGSVRLVPVSAHRLGDDIPIGTLQSMVRQSGLSKALFRK
jgi:predicted RNA binding protein YcfA (HicA-like mRNA interferase family)